MLDDVRQVLVNNDKYIMQLDVATGNCLHVFAEHERQINAFGVTPDERFLISVGGSHDIKIWNIGSGECLGVISNTEYVYEIAVSADGALFATADSYRGTARVYRFEDRSCIHTFDCDADVLSVVFTPDSRFLITGGEAIPNETRIWSLQTGKEEATLSGHTNTVFSVAVSGDGSILATGSADGTARIWNLKSRRCLRTINVSRAAVADVALNEDGQVLLTSSYTREITAWNTRTGRRLERLPPSGYRDAKLHLSSDARSVVISSSEGSLTVYDWSIGKVRRIFDSATYYRWYDTAVIDSRSGQLWSAGGDSIIHRRSSRDGSTNTQYGRGESFLTCLSCTPSIPRCAIGSVGFGAIVIQFRNGKVVRRFDTHRQRVNSIHLSSTGQKLACAPATYPAVFNVDSGLDTNWVVGHAEECTAISMTPAADRVVSASKDGIVKLWSARDHSVHRIFRGHEGAVHAICLHPTNEDEFFTTGKDGTVRRWNINEENARHIFRGHEGAVQALAITPDGRYLISAGDDHRIRIWDLSRNHAGSVIKGHSDTIRDLAISWDGQWLASGSDDWAAKLWRIEEGSLAFVRLFTGHESKVTGVAFGDGDRLLITASWDGTVRFWGRDCGLHLTTYHHLRQGVLWSTPPDKCAPHGWFWTDREDVIDVIECDEKGRYPQALADPARRDAYLTKYNNKSMVLNRLNNFSKYLSDLEERLAARHRKKIDIADDQRRQMQSIGYQPEVEL